MSSRMGTSLGAAEGEGLMGGAGESTLVKERKAE